MCPDASLRGTSLILSNEETKLCYPYHWECKKVVKADRRLMQGLLDAQQSGRNVDMSSILKHKHSCVPLSLANTDGTINSNSKSALPGILSTGIEIATAVSSLYVLSAKVGTCVLIDGHALIQNLGKPAGCRTFSDYADIWYF